jgi:hypothetical protein
VNYENNAMNRNSIPSVLLNNVVMKFVVEDNIEIKYSLLVEAICIALCESCNMKIEELDPSLTTFDFVTNIRCIDGWDDYRFLINLEDRLNIHFTKEQDASFPSLIYSYFSIGEWVKSVVYDWLNRIIEID